MATPEEIARARAVAAGRQARYQADMASRAQRQQQKGPVGASSSLTGFGRQVQIRANMDRHQVNRQKRVQRLLDRRARKGDINAAMMAEQFGARMREEGGPLSQITGPGVREGVATRSLEDEETLAAMRRGDTGGDMSAYQEPYRPPLAPGAQGVPPADATQDSATNSATAAAMRDVPEGADVSRSPDVSVSEPPLATSPEPSMSDLMDQELAEQRERVARETATSPSPTPEATPTVADIDAAAQELGFPPDGASTPDINEAMKRARANANIVAISDGVPYFKTSGGDVVEFPGGMDELNRRAEDEQRYMSSMETVEELKDSGVGEAIEEFQQRELRRNLSAGDRPTAEYAEFMGLPQSVTTRGDRIAMAADEVTVPQDATANVVGSEFEPAATFPSMGEDLSLPVGYDPRLESIFDEDVRRKYESASNPDEITPRSFRGDFSFEGRALQAERLAAQRFAETNPFAARGLSARQQTQQALGQAVQTSGALVMGANIALAEAADATADATVEAGARALGATKGFAQGVFGENPMGYGELRPMSTYLPRN